MPNVTLATVPHFPASLIYDPANLVQGINANESVTSRVPRIITVENMVAGTDISVQASVHPNSAFQEITNLLGATGPVQNITFDPRWNFVKLVRTGAQNILAYAQT